MVMKVYIVTFAVLLALQGVSSFPAEDNGDLEPEAEIDSTLAESQEGVLEDDNLAPESDTVQMEPGLPEENIETEAATVAAPPEVTKPHRFPQEAEIVKIGPDGTITGGINLAQTNNQAHVGQEGNIGMNQNFAIGVNFSKRPGQQGQTTASHTHGLNLGVNVPMMHRYPGYGYPGYFGYRT